MSLHPHPAWTIPDETARVARAAFPKGNAVMNLYDTVGSLYHDHDFAALFAVQGQPAVSPARLMLVTIFQFMDGLTDRQAADAVRSRIDWKYALGLDLTDSGFDFSVLSEFRARIVADASTEQILTRLLDVCTARGWVKARGKQRTDSTHVLAAIRTVNRLECVGETLYHAVHSLVVLDPSWARAHLPADWFERYGVRFDDFRLPTTVPKRQALADTMGADGAWLLTLLHDPASPAILRVVPAVETLRRIWLQQYVAEPGGIRWRTDAELPPLGLLIVSPYDRDARYGVKRETRWTGYKVHLTETCDADSPNVITHVATTPATTQDVTMTATIQADLADHQLLPAEHVVDAGYVDSDLVITSRTQHGIDLVGPVPPDTSWQARAGQGYDVSQFTVDWAAKHVRCPQAHTSVVWRPGRDEDGQAIIHIWFDAATCAACVARPDCTRAATRPRTMKVRPQAQHETLQQARQQQTTADFKQRYARRAGIEGTISQGVHAFDLRHSRYRGLAKTHLQQVVTAVAINVARLVAWWAERPRAQTRHSRFAAPLGAVPHATVRCA
jgi:transposase